MPRASRYLREGYSYHLTHRCHDRRFLLKFARDRDAYRGWLREAATRYRVPIYGYAITCNHVHIVVHAEDVERISQMMHLVAGAFAQQWNRRKSHEGSVWEHPYHCTIIQNGRHLFNCLRYVHLNMVRAGVVDHPSQWRWSGHDELTGMRLRYRIMARERLLQSLEMDCFDDFQSVYNEGIAQALEQRHFAREPAWTEPLAVGDRGFVEHVSQQYDQRRRFTYDEHTGCGDAIAWSVREKQYSYSSIRVLKSAAKPSLETLLTP